MILARWLHYLGSELHQSDVVKLTNYISQCVKDNKVVIICLDITVIDALEAIIGNPSDFVSVLETINQPTVVAALEAIIGNPSDVVSVLEIITQPTVVAASEAIIGNPSDVVLVLGTINQPTVIINQTTVIAAQMLQCYQQRYCFLLQLPHPSLRWHF
jgi:hypothetical protein